MVRGIDLTFGTNAALPRHRWYTLTEGFSGAFVEECLRQAGTKAGDVILDPFSGCGTVAVVAGFSGLSGHFIEVNPLLAFVVECKIIDKVGGAEFSSWALSEVEKVQPFSLPEIMERTPGYTTLRRDNVMGRWLFHDSVLSLALPLSERVNKVAATKEERLLRLALAKAVEQLCNARRSGKAMRYRTGWRDREYDIETVRACIRSAICEIAIDLDAAPLLVGERQVHLGASAFDVLPKLSKNSIDIVVTSPPYLNSRDYTDLYNPDMWLLGFVSSYAEVRQLRAACVDSHLQLRSRAHRDAQSDRIYKLIEDIRERPRDDWLRYLPEMVGGYFGDMNALVLQLGRLIKPGGKAYVNLAESAYCGMRIETLELFSHLVQRIGLFAKVTYVRSIRRSSQQFHCVQELREGVVNISR